MKWSRNFEKCTSCKTTILKHKGNGLCTRCYDTYRLIKKVETSTNLKLEYSGYLAFNDLKNFDKFDKVEQIELIKQTILSNRIYDLVLYGKIENQELQCDVMRIEDIYRRIAQKANCKQYSNTGKMTLFMKEFDEKQRKIIVLSLLKILILK